LFDSAWLIDKVIKAKSQHLHEATIYHESQLSVEDDTRVGLLVQVNEDEDESFHTCSQRSGSERSGDHQIIEPTQPLMQTNGVSQTKRGRTWSGFLGSLFRRLPNQEFESVEN
jgi:hypothetical protein